MDILKLKTVIKEKDAKKFADIAFLVDKKGVLKDIYSFRNKWKIKTLLKVNQVNDWKQELFNNNTDKLLEFERDIHRLLSKHKRHRGYYKALEYALLAGIVPPGAYRHTFWSKGVKQNSEDYFISYKQPVIYISAQSTDADIKRAIREATGYLKEKPDNIYEKYIDRYYKKAKHIDSVRENRNIYWQYLVEKEKGVGIYKRLQAYMKKYLGLKYQKRTLRKIIQRYKEGLQL